MNKPNVTLPPPPKGGGAEGRRQQDNLERGRTCGTPTPPIKTPKK